MSEDLFDIWNREKKLVNNKVISRNLFFHEREIWWISTGFNIGTESNGKNENFERPFLIIKKFNSEMFWGIPLTTKQRIGKYYYKLDYNFTQSTVVLSQLKVLSSKRLLRKMGMISETDLRLIIKDIISLLKIESPLAGAFSEAEATNNNSI